MGAKALVADEQAGNLELARTALERAGYEPLTTPLLDEVLHLARAEEVGLILLGVPLPPDDEISCAIADAIRADPALGGVPIIFMIGGAASRERLPWCLELPGTSFITTPFHPVELVALLKEGLVGHHP